jgi:ubiquinone/menaquinone biosynthesis C-methylase UbiE
MIQPGARPQPYDRHVGRYGPQLAAELIATAGIAPGERALDVGCGLGALTIELARILGEECVAAIDPSESAVETCRARVSEAEVIVAPVEGLPFGDGTFDAALAQLVINLVDDPAAGVREMGRVVRPGGIVTACVWDVSAMPLLSAFWKAAAEITPDEVGVVDQRKQVGLRDPTWLRDLWRGAGLEEVTLGGLATSADYEDFDDLWFSFEQGVGRSGALYLRLDSERREALRSRAHELVGAPRGRFRLDARAWYVRGVA